PRIESLAFTGDKNPDGTYPAILTGQNLEVIDKTAWDPNTGQQVTELPSPLAGQQQKQSLRINMPWPSPSPKAPLYIWLRGESGARLTTTCY
ncbi:MAG: hypothetical protein IT165_28430, partial [Bryobacterales bacterium]|nr:hypothetical protein [Bryobacterales bacterium]